MKPLHFVLILLVSFAVNAQDYFPTNKGVKTKNSKQIILTGATLHLNPLQKIEKGMILVQNGKIIALSSSIAIPKDAIVFDFSGKHSYPSFIELHSDFGIAPIKGSFSERISVQYYPNRKGFYWNDHILPSYNSSSDFKYDSKKAKELISAGFGVINTHRKEATLFLSIGDALDTITHQTELWKRYMEKYSRK